MSNATIKSPKSLAIEAAAQVIPQATGLIEYRSEGHLLIIGSSAQVASIMLKLAEGIRARALLTSQSDTPPEDIAFEASDFDQIAVTGYLGNFEVSSSAPMQRADIVLDMNASPILNVALLPVGYFHAPDESTAARCLEDLNGLIGQFDKPQFFGYKENICAHGASEIEGCRNCIDACPAEAIISIGEKIEVNPYLCQGGGACATVCPTGAITYRYPSANDTLDRIRRMLRAYHEAGGHDSQLVFHGESYNAPATGSDQLPMTLEELASVGIEIWLAALAFGARGVYLAAPEEALLSDPTIQALQSQMDIANTILEGLGLPPAVQWLDNEAPRQVMPELTHATFGATGGKREILFAAIDHLVEYGRNRPDTIGLPDGAPIGRVQVDASGCTLCMSCASVCPAKALADGGGEPALRFYEVNCVQCGLCETACPEQVIRLEPRLLTHAMQRKEAIVLHQEQPFQCIRCNKPFATQSVIEKMQEKLATHPMYQDQQSLERLKMCADCRVKDMM